MNAENITLLGYLLYMYVCMYVCMYVWQNLCFARNDMIRKIYGRSEYNLAWLLIVHVCMAKFRFCKKFHDS